MRYQANDEMCVFCCIMKVIISTLLCGTGSLFLVHSTPLNVEVFNVAGGCFIAAGLAVILFSSCTEHCFGIEGKD